MRRATVALGHARPARDEVRRAPVRRWTSGRAVAETGALTCGRAGRCAAVQPRELACSEGSAPHRRADTASRCGSTSVESRRGRGVGAIGVCEPEEHRVLRQSVTAARRSAPGRPQLRGSLREHHFGGVRREAARRWGPRRNASLRCLEPTCATAAPPAGLSNGLEMRTPQSPPSCRSSPVATAPLRRSGRNRVEVPRRMSWSTVEAPTDRAASQDCSCGSGAAGRAPRGPGGLDGARSAEPSRSGPWTARPELLRPPLSTTPPARCRAEPMRRRRFGGSDSWGPQSPELGVAGRIGGRSRPRIARPSGRACGGKGA